MKNNDKGFLKAVKMYKAGIIAAITGMGIMILGLAGMTGGLIADNIAQGKKNDYIEETVNVAAYHEYFADEKSKLDEEFLSGKLDVDGYKLAFDKLEKNAKEDYIEAFGSAEEKAELQHHNVEIEKTEKVFNGGLGVVGAGMTTTFAALIAAGVTFEKIKKQYPEEIEEDNNME